MSSPLLSIVINCDTRPENSNAEHMFNGCVSNDFITAGILNKIKFFDGFDKEVIVCIDEHLPIDEDSLRYIRTIADCVLIRKHTNELKFNDNNYIRSISLASGDIICKIDQDTNCFTNSKEYVQELIDLLERYSFISYPSLFSPNPDVNANYDYWWCSSRFFICKKESLDLVEIKRMLADSDYMFATYPASIRNPWFEHAIGLWAKFKANGVLYPKIEPDKLLIFSWSSYFAGVLKILNESEYVKVKEWVMSRGINYPNDVHC